MKKSGWVLIALTGIVHISVHFYNKSFESERLADHMARLELNNFISHIVEQSPPVLHLTLPYDTIKVPDANKELALFRILPTVMSYKYTLDISTTLTSERKSEKTRELLSRLEQIVDIDDALTYTSELNRAELELSLAQDEYNTSVKNRQQIALFVFIGIYILGAVLIFAGRRTKTDPDA